MYKHYDRLYYVPDAHLLHVGNQVSATDVMPSQEFVRQFTRKPSRKH